MLAQEAPFHLRFVPNTYNHAYPQGQPHLCLSRSTFWLLPPQSHPSDSGLCVHPNRGGGRRESELDPQLTCAPGSGSPQVNHPKVRGLKQGGLFLLACLQMAGAALPPAVAPGTVLCLGQVGWQSPSSPHDGRSIVGRAEQEAPWLELAHLHSGPYSTG